VLRFGEVDQRSSGGGDELNRYMFVTARLDEDALQPPVMEKLPEETPKDKPAETGDAEDSTDAADGAKDDAGESAPEDEDAPRHQTLQRAVASRSSFSRAGREMRPAKTS